MTIAPALRKIEAELLKMAAESEHDPVDPTALRLLARKVAAQAEMVEEGIAHAE